MARILAADYGRKRVGLAISDPLGVLAQPLETYSGAHPVEHIADIIESRSVERVIVGLPLRMNGEPGRQVEEVERFIDRLRDCTSIPVETLDERLTSVEAQRQIHSMGG